jgi:hypothetical protein
MEYREYVRMSDLYDYLDEYGTIEVSGQDMFMSDIVFKVVEIRCNQKSKYIVTEYGNYYDGPRSIEEGDRRIYRSKNEALIYIVDQLGGLVRIDNWGEV